MLSRFKPFKLFKSFKPCGPEILDCASLISTMVRIGRYRNVGATG